MDGKTERWSCCCFCFCLLGRKGRQKQSEQQPLLLLVAAASVPWESPLAEWLGWPFRSAFPLPASPLSFSTEPWTAAAFGLFLFPPLLPLQLFYKSMMGFAGWGIDQRSAHPIQRSVQLIFFAKNFCCPSSHWIKPYFMVDGLMSNQPMHGFPLINQFFWFFFLANNMLDFFLSLFEKLFHAFIQI